MFEDQERAEAWIACGQRWFDNADPQIVLNIQMLGYAEPPILALEAKLAKPLLEPATIDQGLRLMQCSALSIYWLFGLYEVLRTLKQRAPDRFPPLSQLFYEVEIARMPLAKHEVKGAPGYRKRDHYPTSVWQPETGRVGWHVFDPLAEQMVTVSRSDIADRFLAIRCAD